MYLTENFHFVFIIGHVTLKKCRFCVFGAKRSYVGNGLPREKTYLTETFILGHVTLNKNADSAFLAQKGVISETEEIL